MFGKPSVRRAVAVGAVLLALATACSRGYAAQTVSDSAQATQAPDAPALAPDAAPTPTLPPDAAPAPDFATVSKLMNDAIAAHQAAGRCGGDRARRQGRLPPGLWLAQACGRAGTGWVACTGRADDRGHDLRHGVVDEAPRNGDCRHAALRTRQGSVRRSRAAVSAGLQPGERSPAGKGDRSHVADAHFRRNGRRRPQRSVGTGRSR